jgi:hypothetical protein
MANWSVEHRVVCVRTFFECKSVVKVQKAFPVNFQTARHGSVPTRNTILKSVERFNATGKVTEQFVGTQRTVLTPETVDRLGQAVALSPTRSVRQQSLALNISLGSLFRILHEDLKLHPYKIQIVQELRANDAPTRLQFCKTMLDILNDDPTVLKRLVLFDEAHFHLLGYVNKQNFRYWDDHHPEQMVAISLHTAKVTVWCGVSAFGIIGPYFFEENNRTVTVTAARYQVMLALLE